MVYVYYDLPLPFHLIYVLLSAELQFLEKSDNGI